MARGRARSHCNISTKKYCAWHERSALALEGSCYAISRGFIERWAKLQPAQANEGISTSFYTVGARIIRKTRGKNLQRQFDDPSACYIKVRKTRSKDS